MEATEFEREAILNELFKFTAYAVSGTLLLIVCPEGKALIKKEEKDGVPLLIIEYRCNRISPRKTVSFWMNESSLRTLGEALRSASNKRQDWKKLF